MLISVTPEVSIGEILQTGVIFLSVIGSVITFWISRQRDRKVKAVEQVVKLWDMWLDDMDDALDMIIHDRLKCDGPNGYWEKDDGKLYTLLFFLEVMCMMKKSKMISEVDLGLYTYDIVTVHGNEEVKIYISKMEKELADKKCAAKMFAESRAVYTKLIDSR